ncbi:50S ribosomal protein L7ae [Candidatus Woesearchaeota archaeon]|nr:MAG: 50S ribosomal protein L7ae [Candidatus Woesearchaeota archaeon]
MADNEKVYQAIELAKSTGKIRKGTNEVTKAIEKGQAKLVAIASDVSPKEIVMHMPILAKEKGIPCFEVGVKEELGAAAGIPVGTASVVVIKEGEAKDIIAELAKSE